MKWTGDKKSVGGVKGKGCRVYCPSLDEDGHTDYDSWKQWLEGKVKIGLRCMPIIHTVRMGSDEYTMNSLVSMVGLRSGGISSSITREALRTVQYFWARDLIPKAMWKGQSTPRRTGNYHVEMEYLVDVIRNLAVSCVFCGAQLLSLAVADDIVAESVGRLVERRLQHWDAAWHESMLQKLVCPSCEQLIVRHSFLGSYGEIPQHILSQHSTKYSSLHVMSSPRGDIQLCQAMTRVITAGDRGRY